jgi:hypothetical protein
MRKKQQQAADNWNARHAVGAAVTVQRDNGVILHTTTRSKAWVVESGIAVVQVEGIAGCYALERVQPSEQQASVK